MPASAILRDLKEGSKRGLNWDVESVTRAINFCSGIETEWWRARRCAIYSSARQCFIVGSVFGWKRENGTRRFRTVYVESGKGSGKSPLAAGVGLYCMMADKEPRAEVYAAATKKTGP